MYAVAEGQSRPKFFMRVQKFEILSVICLKLENFNNKITAGARPDNVRMLWNQWSFMADSEVSHTHTVPLIEVALMTNGSIATS